MRIGLCEGCGERGLLIGFRGEHCVSCIAGASDDRSGYHDFDPEAGREQAALYRKSPSYGCGHPKRGGRARVMTPEKISECQRMRADGAKLRELAERFHVTEACIMQYVPRVRSGQ